MSLYIRLSWKEPNLEIFFADTWWHMVISVAIYRLWVSVYKFKKWFVASLYHTIPACEPASQNSNLSSFCDNLTYMYIVKYHPWGYNLHKACFKQVIPERVSASCPGTPWDCSWCHTLRCPSSETRPRRTPRCRRSCGRSDRPPSPQHRGE